MGRLQMRARRHNAVCILALVSVVMSVRAQHVSPRVPVEQLLPRTLAVSGEHNVPSDAGAVLSAGRRTMTTERGISAPLPEGSQCRNTFIRPWLIVDDQGFVCSRFEQGAFDPANTQCCLARKGEFQHTCSKCDETSGCCREFEHCVSFCIGPSNKGTLKAGDVWDQCLDRCRTSSRSILNGNRYLSDLKHCYLDVDPPMYQAGGGNDVTIVGAERANESCDAVCQAKGMTCSQSGFLRLNHCNMLQKHMPCSTCKSSVGAEQPAFVIASAPQANTCLFSSDPGIITCEAAHETTRRLCPCVAAA